MVVVGLRSKAFSRDHQDTSNVQLPMLDITSREPVTDKEVGRRRTDYMSLWITLSTDHLWSPYGIGQTIYIFML